MSYDLFIFAGEPSGDLHGEKLLQELYTLNPKLKIKGVGGPRMRAAGLEPFLKMEEFEVMGFIDVLGSFPHLYKLFKTIRHELLSSAPKAALFIDYPGFNLRMARSLKKKKSKTKCFHYVCPSVWAWGKRRIPLMEKNLDKLFTILPFEPSLFNQDHFDVTYVGHPLISRIKNHVYERNWREKYGISEDQTLLSLFPGSREKELDRNFELQLKVAKKLTREKKDYLIAISCASEKVLSRLQTYADDQVKIIAPEHVYELMRASHLAIATSGTVTLELALHQVPTTVAYAISLLDTFLATKVFRIQLPYYSLPNLIANHEIFPELFGPRLTEESLTQCVKEQLMSQFKRSECMQGCQRLKDQLGHQNASREVALAIVNALN